MDMSGQKMDFSIRDLEGIAKVYNPSLWAAPLVLGHPDTDDPAYGEVKRLFVLGDSLYADAEVDGVLIELVRSGSYTNRSCALYPPGHAANPVPHSTYLKHVGFLGAHPPALKGLDRLSFGEKGMNPLVADALSRGVLHSPATPIRYLSPLVADAEARRLRYMMPQSNISSVLFAAGN